MHAEALAVHEGFKRIRDVLLRSCKINLNDEHTTEQTKENPSPNNIPSTRMGKEPTQPLLIHRLCPHRPPPAHIRQHKDAELALASRSRRLPHRENITLQLLS